MMAPVDAVARSNRRLGVGIGHWDLFEYNEAFSVQALAVVRETGADPSRVNVNGGAVAIGHPIGASGGRVLATLLHALRARAAAAVSRRCVGGGNAVAMGVEVVA
jgi:acetyl-CoA C-acetyltransferase